jgi:hypothetical protein
VVSGVVRVAERPGAAGAAGGGSHPPLPFTDTVPLHPPPTPAEALYETPPVLTETVAPASGGGAVVGVGPVGAGRPGWGRGVETGAIDTVVGTGPVVAGF